MSFSTDSSFFFSGLSLRSFFIWCQFDRVCVCACSCACEESSFFHLPFVNACSPSFFNLSFVLFFIFNFFYFINLLVRPRVDETNEMKNKNQQFKIIAFPLYCVCVCWRLTRVSRWETLLLRFSTLRLEFSFSSALVRSLIRRCLCHAVCAVLLFGVLWCVEIYIHVYISSSNFQPTNVCNSGHIISLWDYTRTRKMGWHTLWTAERRRRRRGQ